ncbi:sugar ABC transporter permease, partial [Curtobacterium flaccumfaciens]|nr:sugar ABC transporter permease [Curtobacterium flaccumfaciens]
MTINTERPPAAAAPARTTRSSGRGAPAPRANGGRAPRRTDGWWPWLFVLPLLVGVGTFYIWPIIQTFWYS